MRAAKGPPGGRGSRVPHALAIRFASSRPAAFAFEAQSTQAETDRLALTAVARPSGEEVLSVFARKQQTHWCSFSSSSGSYPDMTTTVAHICFHSLRVLPQSFLPGDRKLTLGWKKVKSPRKLTSMTRAESESALELPFDKAADLNFLKGPR